MSEKDSQLSFEDVAASEAAQAAQAAQAPHAPEVTETKASVTATADGSNSEASLDQDESTTAPAPEATASDQPKPEVATPADTSVKPAGIRRELIKPGKIFYKMGDVCDITGLEPHVLRFWEAEFEQLQPKKNRSGHRIYTVEDIELVICIRRLLHEEGYTIPGARKKLEDPAYESGENHRKPREMQFILNEISGIRKSLESAIKLLDGP